MSDSKVKIKKLFLSKKEGKNFLKRVTAEFNFIEGIFDEKKKVQKVVFKLKDKIKTIIVIDDIPAFIDVNDRLIPTLTLVNLAIDKVKKIVVDSGAVPHIARGADVMAPGITQFDEDIGVGSLVAVLEEVHKSLIAVGEALMSSEDLKKPGIRGKAVKNFHHVGDDAWRYIKLLSKG